MMGRFKIIFFEEHFYVYYCFKHLEKFAFLFFHLKCHCLFIAYYILSVLVCVVYAIIYSLLTIYSVYLSV